MADREMRGIRQVSTFLTADTLLAAVLLVWAQLWIQPSVQLWAASYGVNQTGEILDMLQRFDRNVGFGLIYTYGAVFLALLALIMVVVSSSKGSGDDEVSDVSLGFFVVSAGMALGNVLQSGISILIKWFSSAYLIWDPFRSSLSWLPGITLIIVPIVVFFLWCTSK